jgi:hypothetical protein
MVLQILCLPFVDSREINFMLFLAPMKTLVTFRKSFLKPSSESFFRFQTGSYDSKKKKIVLWKAACDSKNYSEIDIYRVGIGGFFLHPTRLPFS